MKGMAAEYNLRPEKIGTHSVRISGATALLLAGIPPATVQIIGRWVSNSFIGYQRYKAELMKGIADRMVRTHYATNIQKEMTSLEYLRPQGHLSRCTLFGDHRKGVDGLSFPNRNL